MRCPACQQAIGETAESCSCGFSLPALEKMMGFAPPLKPDITDMTGEMAAREIGKVRRKIAEFGRRFPQARCAVVVSATPTNITLPLFAFWLLNKGGLSSAVERGGANRVVLIVLDPEAQKVACMIGYGLEPFVAEGRLIASLQAGLPSFAAHDVAAGLCACIGQLETHLTEVAASLNQTYGLGEEYEGLEQLWETEHAALAY